MKWIDVKQELPPTKPMYPDGPESSGYVLIFTGHVMLGKYEQTFKGRKWKWDAMHYKNANVTHWMPLPDAPPETES